MITKEINKSVAQTNMFYLSEREDGTPVLEFQFGEKPRQFDIETADDLGRLLEVLVGAMEWSVVKDGNLMLQHTLAPKPGYWFVLGPDIMFHRPPSENTSGAFFLTNAEAFVLTEALRMKCVRVANKVVKR